MKNSKENVESIRRLMLATNKIDGAYYFFSKKLGIKANTLALLYALDDGRPHSQKQISEDWLIPKTPINTNIRELTEAGYVRLFPEEGTREKTIGLTDSGKLYADDILKTVYESEQAAIAKALERFSPEFRDAMAYFSDCLRDEFRKRSQSKDAVQS